MLHLSSPLVKDHLQSVKIEIWDYVHRIPVPVVVVTISAVNAMVPIKLEMLKNVTGSSTSEGSNIELCSIVETRAAEVKSHVLRSLKNTSRKRPLNTTKVGDQKFQRGFVWDSGQFTAPSSPSAMDTKNAPPLPLSPQHLLENLIYQATLKALQSNIHVETPFNTDKFEKILWDHPNQPFVQSVI